MSMYCECGHTLDEHAGDDQGTTCLAIDGCKCECFEESLDHQLKGDCD